MRTISKIIIRLLSATLVFFVAGLALAQHDSSRSEASASSKFKTVNDIQSGVTKLGRKSTVQDSLKWKKERLRRDWQEMFPKRETLTEAQLQKLVRGNVDVLKSLPTEFQQHVVLIIGHGYETLEYTVGMLLRSRSDGTFEPECSATLINPHTVLTAGHCFEDKNSHQYKVYFPFEGIREFPTSNVSEFCDEYDGPDFCGEIDDLARITLPDPYEFLKPENMFLHIEEPFDFKATVVGFGFNDIETGFNTDHGIKRSADITVKECLPCSFEPSDSDPSYGGRVRCFYYDLSDTSSPEPGILEYDSGGPMLFNIVTPIVGIAGVVGVASGYEEICILPATSRAAYMNAGHEKYSSWLQESDCAPACISQSSDLINELLDKSSEQIEEGDHREYDQTIGPFAKKLIVTMNHEVGGVASPNDLSLELPDSFNGVCDRNHGVEVCIVNKPPAGDFTIKVINEKGDDPLYQITAVTVDCNGIFCWLQFWFQNLVKQAFSHFHTIHIAMNRFVDEI